MNKHHLRIFVWGAVILLLFEAIAFGLISRGCKPEWMSRANNVRKLSLGLIAYNADFYSKKLPEGTAQHPKSLSDLIPNQYIMEVDLPQLTQNLESVSIPDPGSIYKPTDVVILATYKKDQIIVYASGDIIHRKK